MKQIHVHIIVIIILWASAGEARAQWTVGPLPYIELLSPAPLRLTDIVMIDSLTAIAVGLEGDVLRTTDGGKTWDASPGHLLSVFAPRNGLAFFDAKHAIVVCDRGVVLTTRDAGQRWAWPYTILGGSNQPRRCLSAVYAGATNIYVGADSGWVFHSLDGGTTWSSEKVSEYPIRSLFVWRGTYAMGLRVYALTPHSILSKTEFPPSSWKETPLPAFQGLSSEAFDGEFSHGGGPGFLVGVQGDKHMAPIVLRKASSTDSIWEGRTTGMHMDGAIYGVSAPSDSVIYICGTGGSIYRSGDSGLTWSLQLVPTTKTLRAISFFDEKHGIAVGDSGIILHTTSGGVTSVRHNGMPVLSQYRLENNYPNPFNPSTTISFNLPSRLFVSLKIFDALGREVTVVCSEELATGRHSRQWNAESFPSGVYFYRLQAGVYSETKMLQLLK